MEDSEDLIINTMFSLDLSPEDEKHERLYVMADTSLDQFNISKMNAEYGKNVALPNESDYSASAFAPATMSRKFYSGGQGQGSQDFDMYKPMAGKVKKPFHPISRPPLPQSQLGQHEQPMQFSQPSQPSFVPRTAQLGQFSQFSQPSQPSQPNQPNQPNPVLRTAQFNQPDQFSHLGQSIQSAQSAQPGGVKPKVTTAELKESFNRLENKVDSLANTNITIKSQIEDIRSMMHKSENKMQEFMKQFIGEISRMQEKHAENIQLLINQRSKELFDKMNENENELEESEHEYQDQSAQLVQTTQTTQEITTNEPEGSNSEGDDILEA